MLKFWGKIWKEAIMLWGNKELQTFSEPLYYHK